MPNFALEAELQRHFGFDAFRPGQKALVEAVLSGHDALGVMPTGGGKSLCFQLPAVLLPGTALVVSPLIALMKDQVDAQRARGIHAEAFNSTLSAAERRQVLSSVRSGKARLLYMAPERIQQEAFMELLGGIPISLLAIDEAHCISSWGHDFRPDYRRLGELRGMLTPAGRRLSVIALTATATQTVQRDIADRLHMENPVRVITGFRRTNLSFEVKKCSGRAEKFATLRKLLSQALQEGGSAVIYAATRKNVELVASELKDLGVGYYHAGLADQERARVQEDFIADRSRVLVATNAFGMGIDKPTVRLVAHYDIPGSVEAYYQEAGRAGRDGLPARCVLLFNYADVATQNFFIEQSANGANSQNQQELLKQLVRYAYASTCRQQLILGYFGDPEARNFDGCGLCDCCKPEERQRTQASELTALASRQVLAAVARINGRFGKNRICEMLKGSESASFLNSGLQRQSTYGLLRDWTADSIRVLIDRLTGDGYLKISGLDYPVLSLTSLGVQAMKGEVPILLSRGTAEDEPAAPSAKRRGAGKADSDAEDDSLPDADPRLFEELKRFRSEEAREKKVPAYVVFHDKTLREIAARKPSELEDLSRIPGLGPRKLELYGERILAIVGESC